MSYSVLIVDDEPANAELVKAFLSDMDVRFHVLNEATNVGEVFVKLQPDVVFLDLHMPGVDGFEVLEALHRQRQQIVFVPIIVLTADTRSYARDRALVLGADDFLVKPLNREEVRLRFRNLLNTRQLHLELDKIRRSARKA